MSERVPRLGAIVDRQRPATFERWDNGFNGQRERQRMMDAIVQAISFDAFIETGTFRGATAAYVRREFDLPVWSVELLPRSFHLCRWRFMRDQAVELFVGDSREFLRRMSSSHGGRRCLFYLDAHWYDDLPLAEELRIISRSWAEWVVVIDDFRVDDDSSYYWDDYGPGRSLELANIPLPDIEPVSAYFPVARGLDDTYPWRGSVVLARGAAVKRELDVCSLVRPVPASLVRAEASGPGPAGC